eukprot:GFUD01026728.1.p1 GENE.GFUD01026728.1~~GFUD01026728.1.p1  ORF type:complete len:245 (+),score=35.39 GFUD01026728.1:159-893(+)
MTREKDERVVKQSNSGYLDQFSRFVDENKRPITYALYGVSSVGGILILRSLRVFKQFKNVKDVPAEFVENNHNIFGKVERSEIVTINSNIAPCVVLTHIPIFGKFRRNQKNEIPVLISGVRLHPDQFVVAKQVLQDVTENKKVKVTLFGSSLEELQGKVCLKKYGFWNDCLGETLVKRGFAQILLKDFEKSDSKVLQNYRIKLEKQEAYAKKKKVGLWMVDKDTTGTPSRFSLLEKIANFFKFK